MAESAELARSSILTFPCGRPSRKLSLHNGGIVRADLALAREPARLLGPFLLFSFFFLSVSLAQRHDSASPDTLRTDAGFFLALGTVGRHAVRYSRGRDHACGAP